MSSRRAPPRMSVHDNCGDTRYTCAVMTGRFHRISCFALALSLILASARVEAQVAWTAVGNDLEQAHIDISPGTLFSAQLVLIRTSLSNFRVEVLRALDFGKARASVAEMCKASKAQLCINANFFDEAGNALGLIVHRGIQLQDIHRGGKTLTGIFYASRDMIKIIPRTSYQPERVLEAVQAGPRILHARQPVAGIELTSRSRRSGICIDGKDRLVFFVVSSGLLGVSMQELQSALRHPEIDCAEALNLDGGGSSQLYMSNALPGAVAGLDEINIITRDDVPVALALFAK